MAESVLSSLLLLLLLLLFDVAGALLAPASSADDVDFFFPPYLVLYKSGRVQRFTGTDTVPAGTDPATGVVSRDVVIDADTGLAARLYLPNISITATSSCGSKLPLFVFYHGGAFVTESAFSPTYHRYLNALVSAARVVAVSVNYRLAPEHPVPAAYDDAWTALRWAVRNARAAGTDPWLSRHADPARLFLVGDSAGGNIAHNTAMRAGGTGREGLDPGCGATTIRGVALLDPYFWGKIPVPGETRDVAARRWRERTWSFVSAGRYGIDDPVVNPVAMASEEWRRRFPCARVLVTVAGLDVLSARGRAYVHALKASGWQGEVELYETPGEGHDYFLTEAESEEAAKEMQAVVDFIHGDDQMSPAISSLELADDHGKTTSDRAF